MHGWMDGWADAETDRQMDGWMDRQAHRLMDEWMDGKLRWFGINDSFHCTNCQVNIQKMFLFVFRNRRRRTMAESTGSCQLQTPSC